mgnify:CR=1 FL=1
MSRLDYRREALLICAELVAEVRARMEAPPPPETGKRRWSNIALACFDSSIEAIEEVAKRIAQTKKPGGLR